MSSSWPLIRLGDVLAVQRRWLRPEPDHKYVEIGVRSYGRGIFHKPPVSGLSLGDKRVLRIEPGDLVFMNVFAWEGAVAVASTRDTNTIGSHRFITMIPIDGRVDPYFLQRYFQTPIGRALLLRVSPGSAGRNRTMSIEGFLREPVPLPPLAEQRRIVTRLDALAAKIDAAKAIKAEASANARYFWKSLSQLARSTPGTSMRLDDVADFLDGKRRPLSSEQRATFKGEYPYYGASGIIDRVREFLFDEDLLLLSEDGANLINRSTPIAFIATGRYWVNNHAHVLRPRSGVADIEFLKWSLADYDVSRFNFASAQAKLNQRNAASITLLIPPLDIQRAVVARIAQLWSLAERSTQSHVTGEACIAALLPSLLDRAFAGAL